MHTVDKTRSAHWVAQQREDAHIAKKRACFFRKNQNFKNYSHFANLFANSKTILFSKFVHIFKKDANLEFFNKLKYVQDFSENVSVFQICSEIQTMFFF